MLLNRLTQYLNETPFCFTYVRDDPRMEIWVTGKEWFPILVSKGGPQRYLISWGEIIYLADGEEKAYSYILRICKNIKESRRVDSELALV